MTYAFDSVGNLTSITDRISTGRKREYTYDNLDRVTKETWKSTSGAAIHSIYYAYDTAGRLDTVKELRGSQSGTPVLEYDYAYDNLDRVTSVIDTANGAANSQTPNTVPTVPVTLNDHFKTNGDLKDVFTKINNTADFANLYTFDNLGRMTQVVQRQFTAAEQTSYGTSGTNTIQRKRANLAYNAAGQFSKIVRAAWIGSGDTEVATSVYSYFNGGGIKQIANWHSGLAAGTTVPTSLGTSISSYSWTYDTAGRAASFSAPEGSFVYGYDNTNQLTSSSFTPLVVPPSGGPATESFNFDSTGNRNSQTVAGTTTTTTVNHNRLLSDGTYNYTYDGEGNRATRTEIATGKVVNYTWDHRDRLTVVEFRNSAGGTLTKKVINSYDAFDRRVMKQVDDNGDGTLDRTERYVWDGDQISLVLDANGAVLHRFLHGPAIDQIFADESSVDGLLWDLGDNQNTTRDVINNTGTVVNHITYSAFGVMVSESNTAKTPFFAYTGRDWDEDLQLQYNRARWYEPSSGRWLSEDPDRFGAGDVNLQRYVGNHSTNAVDPNGLAEFKIDGYNFFVHPNDVDPFPSKPHAHIDCPNSPRKLNINTGEIFHGGKGLGKFVPKKTLEKLRCALRGKGLLAVGATAVLLMPDVLQAAQTDGAMGVADLAGEAVIDAAKGTLASAVVGVTIVEGASAVGTTVLVGGTLGTGVAGTAATGIVASTGVGAAVIGVGAGGYWIGSHIADAPIGSTTLSKRIGNFMYSLTPSLFNW